MDAIMSLDGKLKRISFARTRDNAHSTPKLRESVGLRKNSARAYRGCDDVPDPSRGVAVNALLDDFSVHDNGARLWPQTERIKAAALAAEVTGEAKYWGMAVAGAEGLMKYLRTPVVGLWRDKYQPDQTFVEEPAPASSFYHISLAIAELDRLVSSDFARA